MPQQKQHTRNQMKALILLAFCLRLVLAAATEGYTYDTGCFMAWGLKMAEGGAAGFYSADYFADYPPGYMLVLGLVGRVIRAFDLDYTGKLAHVVLTFVPALCDCALAALVYFMGEKAGHPRAALRIGGFVAFCPVLLFDTAVWKQIDGVQALAVVACFWLLSQKRYLPAAVAYGLALAIKPQALLVGPVLALAFAAPLLERGDGTQKLRTVGRAAGGALAALAVPVACGLPFWGSQVIAKLIEKYTTTSQSYPYASINAFDAMALLGGNWADQDQLFGPISFRQWGTLCLVLLTGALVYLAWRSQKAGRFDPLLLAAFYAVGVFTLSHRMHERYLVMGAMLVLAAAAVRGEKRLLALGCGFSVTSMLNLATVYCQVGTDDEWLNSTTSQMFIEICSAAQVVLFALLVITVVDLLLRGRAVELTLPETEETPPAPAAQPAWTRNEKLFLLGLTGLVAAVSLWNLGDFTAPQNGLNAVNATPQVVTATVEAGQTLPTRVWIYPGVNSGGTITVVADDTGGTFEQTVDYGNVFRWLPMEVDASGSYTVTVTEARVMEIAFRDEAGNPVAVTGAGPLFDEQDAVPGEISYKNSTYFDEIYHGRTGYEMLHGMTVYETTHPPLGKDLIMLGIAIFGMTGFGWRISGTIFGILMVPMLYLLARRLTRRPTLAALAGILLGVDCMRFAQSRIATIDVYVTFFILLSAYCMLWYAQSVLEKGVQRSILPMALCGLAFGLGCASKWTGIYAGAGLAVVYFWILWLRYRQKKPGFAGEAALAVAGGVVFFVVVPVAIYIASYLPYWVRDPSFGLRDLWDCQTYMYWYHSTLEASHPFESRWYTWLFDLRPVWYYQGSGLAEGQYASIAGFGNPVVWLAATAGVMRLAVGRLCGKGDRRWTAVLVLYAAQLLPWMLVTRCTFLYHAFPSLGFALLAGVLCLEALAKAEPKRARRLGIGLCVAAGAAFVFWYPAVSGMTVPAGWAAAMRALPGWGFYII